MASAGRLRHLNGTTHRLHFLRLLCTCSTEAPSSPSSSSSPLKRAIHSLFKERDLDRLVSLFKSSAAHSRFRRRHSVHEVTVRRLALHNRLDGVAEVLESLKLYPADIAREGFAVRIIRLYGKARMADHAASTFRELPSLGCPVTCMSFNALLSAYVDSAAPSRAVEFFFSQLKIVPDLFSYNILIHALCATNEVDAALKTAGIMEEEKGIRPNLVTYNTLLHGFYATGRSLEEAEEKVWSRMEARGCVPDVRSFNEKLAAAVDRGVGMAEVLKVFEEMRRREMRANTYTYNALIKGCVAEGSLDPAKSYFRALDLDTHKGCHPNAATFESLIPAVCQAGEEELDLAFRLSKRGMNHLVDSKVLQLAVDALANGSRFEDAKKLVDLGNARECYKDSTFNLLVHHP